VLDDDSAAEPGRVLREMLVDPGLRGIADRPEQEDRAVVLEVEVDRRRRAVGLEQVSLLARFAGRIGLGALATFSGNPARLASADGGLWMLFRILPQELAEAQ